MATYSPWVMIFWSICDECCTSEHPFFSGFEAEKGLRVIYACVLYTAFYGRLLGQVLEKLCVRSKGHIFSQIIMKLGQNVCLEVILDEFEKGSCWVKI